MRRLITRIHQMKLAEKSPDENGDGKISPQELHRHFDRDNDGSVDMGDYAHHIQEHVEHPEWLEGKSAMERLARRLEKRAFSLGEMLRAGGNAALSNAVVGGGIGGLTQLPEPKYPEGVRVPSRAGRFAHGALTGAVISAVPSAISGMYSNYREQKARDEALRNYQQQGGYGHEFLR